MVNEPHRPQNLQRSTSASEPSICLKFYGSPHGEQNHGRSCRVPFACLCYRAAARPGARLPRMLSSCRGRGAELPRMLASCRGRGRDRLARRFRFRGTCSEATAPGGIFTNPLPVVDIWNDLDAPARMANYMWRTADRQIISWSAPPGDSPSLWRQHCPLYRGGDSCRLSPRIGPLF